MDENEVRRYVGKKCIISLKNGQTYTGIIPNFVSDTITIIDKYGEEISFTCDFISFIDPIDDDKKVERFFRRESK